MDARAFASPKRLRPRRRVKPAHDGESMQIFSMLRVAAFAATAFMSAAQPALAQRGASCHGGQSFEQFLAGLKQQALAAGVSQAAIAAASPYLVYDQGIVNRDRGQRVFGQVFTVFAARMAAAYRVQH